MINLKDWGVASHGAELRIYDTTGLENWRAFSIDCETDETQSSNNICSIAMSPHGGLVYFFRKGNPNWDSESLRRAIETSFLYGQNIKGDLHWLRNNGFNVRSEQVKFDTQLAAYVMCSTNDLLSLKDLTKEYLGWNYPKYKEVRDKKVFREYACSLKPELMVPSKARIKPGKKPKMLLPRHVLMPDQPTDVLSNYNGMDALCTTVLADVFSKGMTGPQKKYLNTIEMPVMRVCYEMEKKGIKVDINKLATYHRGWEAERAKYYRELKLHGGEEFNPKSNPSKLHLLQKCVSKYIRASNKDALKSYMDNPIVQALQEFNQYQKLVSTYSGPILQKALADPHNRIHTTFNQVASQSQKDGGKTKPIRTGRFSSSDPNLQNIHAKNDDPDVEEKEEAHPLREIFIPEDGHKFVGSDFSQIEYRLLAHDSQDPTLIKAYMEGYDIHKLTADTLGCGRKLAKNINFGIVYGAWPKKISELARCSLEEAEEFIKIHEDRFPNVGRWKHGLLDTARKAGGVTTMWGRFIPIPSLRSFDEWEVGRAERQVVDYRIQGSAAEILKMALIRIYRKHGIVPVLSVHDEIILESLDKDANRDVCILSYEMENVIQLRVPLIAKASIGMSWAECK